MVNFRISRNPNDLMSFARKLEAEKAAGQNIDKSTTAMLAHGKFNFIGYCVDGLVGCPSL